MSAEPIELEDDRPPRRPRREYEDAPSRGSYAEAPRRAPAAPRDPFFDKPYEPSAAADSAPAWEATAKAAPAPARGGLSPNIRPKRKVASLLGGNR